MRTKGSCRFAAYYKVQYYDERSLTWRDIQMSFGSPDNAETFARTTEYAKTRIMEVTEKGRKPL